MLEIKEEGKGKGVIKKIGKKKEKMRIVPPVSSSAKKYPSDSYVMLAHTC